MIHVMRIVCNCNKAIGCERTVVAGASAVCYSIDGSSVAGASARASDLDGIDACLVCRFRQTSYSLRAST